MRSCLEFRFVPPSAQHALCIHMCDLQSKDDKFIIADLHYCAADNSLFIFCWDPQQRHKLIKTHQQYVKMLMQVEGRRDATLVCFNKAPALLRPATQMKGTF